MRSALFVRNVSHLWGDEAGAPQIRSAAETYSRVKTVDNNTEAPFVSDQKGKTGTWVSVLLSGSACDP